MFFKTPVLAGGEGQKDPKPHLTIRGRKRMAPETPKIRWAKTELPVPKGGGVASKIVHEEYRASLFIVREPAHQDLSATLTSTGRPGQ